MFRNASSVKNYIYRCLEAGQHLHSPLASVVDVSHSTILLELALDVPVSHVLVDPVHKEFAPLLRRGRALPGAARLVARGEAVPVSPDTKEGCPQRAHGAGPRAIWTRRRKCERPRTK